MMKSNEAEVPRGESGGTVCRTGSLSKKRLTSPFLPEEVIFAILTWIPAEILYRQMRHVCKLWYDIISSPNFMNEHRPSRDSGLFFTHDGYGYFTSLENSRPRMSKVMFPSRYIFWASCDGLLLLLLEQMSDRTMYIANPLTRRITVIPPFRVEHRFHTLSFACTRSTKEYKVVLTNNTDQQTYECALLTLGIGCAWKSIHSQELSAYLNIMVGSYSVGEIIFWASNIASHIFCMCVETEAIYRIPSPTVDPEGYCSCYVAGREFLCSMVWYKYNGGRLIDIWSLVNPKGAAEWRKMYKLDLGVHVPANTMDPRIPVALVNNEVVVICNDPYQGPLLGYNVKTGEIIELERRQYWRAGFYGDFAWGLTWIPLK